MTELVVCLGKDNWKYVEDLINAEGWEKIFVVTNLYGAEKFVLEGKTLNFVILNEKMNSFQLVDLIQKQLDGNLSGPEVAVNLVSGKEHMAVISALLKSGVGIRLIGLDNNKIREF